MAKRHGGRPLIPTALKKFIRAKLLGADKKAPLARQISAWHAELRRDHPDLLGKRKPGTFSTLVYKIRQQDAKSSGAKKSRARSRPRSRRNAQAAKPARELSQELARKLGFLQQVRIAVSEAEEIVKELRRVNLEVVYRHDEVLLKPLK
ncbi:MAG: hypothetical protein AAB402_01435 [Patescibacteria group bacterium]